MVEAAFVGTLIPLLFLLLILRHSRPIMSVFCWGMVAFLLSYYANGWLSGYLRLTDDPFRVAVFVAPVVEEAFKMLPLGYFLLRAPRSFVPYIYIFGMAIGIGFAIEENLLYLMGAAGSDQASQRLFMILRSVSTCLMHGMTTGMIGYACTVVRRHGGLTPALVPLAYALAVLLHGVFNYLVFSQMLLLSVTVPAAAYLAGALVIKRRESRQTALQEGESLPR